MHPAFDDRGAEGVRRNFTGIGANGMEALSVFLVRSQVLQKLSIRGGVIGNEGAVILARCFQVNPHLGARICFLDLTGNNISMAGEEA